MVLDGARRFCGWRKRDKDESGAMGNIQRAADAPRNRKARRLVPQKTLRSSVHCTGIGLHSGRKVTMTLKPAEPNAGITFVRTDIGGVRTPGRWDHVVDTRLCTVVGNSDGVTIGTVEHLMAALSGLNVDNVIVEVDGPELPVMDGSSGPFVFLIECAGLLEQACARRAIRVLKPVSAAGDGWAVSLVPGNGFSVGVEIDYGRSVVGSQSLVMDLVSGAFKKELARARTFGFLDEVQELRAAGLARGGSLDNAVVISGDCILNEEGLRYPDEFVRHKVLDAVGDLYLAGAPIIGHFSGIRSGHTGNNRLLRTLFARSDAWTWDDLYRSGEGPAPVDRSRRPEFVPALAV
jgi:UDP-3-O-[3-hydroxymyristoyl] N-acetylglucosamine deacetylase